MVVFTWYRWQQVVIQCMSVLVCWSRKNRAGTETPLLCGVTNAVYRTSGLVKSLERLVTWLVGLACARC